MLMRRIAYRSSMFVLAIASVVVLWEGYKIVGPQDGGKLFGVSILPRANNTAMPHVWDMLSRYNRPEVRGSDTKIWSVVLSGTLFSLRLSLVGFFLGTTIGVGLAVLMSRFKVVQRGLLPYLVMSQTVPLIALAPLAFFPIAVGTLRGLASAPAAAVELMDSYAASWKQTLFKLRFPAAVPFMVPAFKLGASGAVVGVVVAEISTGLKGGIGRLIIEYAREATGDPAKVFTAVFGAAALGITMSGLVALSDVLLMRNRPKETSA
jgi:NitT/TauT family transport system permease protein